MSSTDTNRRIPSTATVLIALALAFLAAIAMAACAPADLPTAPDSEVEEAAPALPVAFASADGRIEGGTQIIPWANCPANLPAELACQDHGSTIAVTSVDNNIVEGDRSHRVTYRDENGYGRTSNIEVIDDDIAYVQFRERVTGSSWPKRADHDDRQFPLALICQHWHDVNGSNEIGAAGWVDIVPTLCSRDYQYIWEYLGTQTAWIDCTVGDAVTSTTMRYQTNQAWVDGTLWPAYRGGCRTYTPERAWFFSLSKPLALDNHGSGDARITKDRWILQILNSYGRLEMPTVDGEYAVSGREVDSAWQYCQPIRGVRTYTNGLNSGVSSRIDSPQIIVEYPDGMDLCSP